MRIVILLGIIVNLYGCSPSSEYVPGIYRSGQYSNLLQNATHGRIDEVRVEWNTQGQHYTQEAGSLSFCPDINHGACFDFCPEPVPDEAVIKWRTPDGRDHAESLKVAERVPGGIHFAGTIVYKVYDDHVTVVPVPQWLEDRNAMLGKTIVP